VLFPLAEGKGCCLSTEGRLGESPPVSHPENNEWGRILQRKKKTVTRAAKEKALASASIGESKALTFLQTFSRGEEG